MDDPGLAAQALSNLIKVSAPEEITELCKILNIQLLKDETPLIIPSTEAERKQAALDQYADLVLPVQESMSGTPSENDDSFLEIAKYVPLRLEFEERRLLRLLESTIDSSEYTDRVESAPPAVTAHQLHRHTATVLKNICSVLSGLVVANSDGVESFEKLVTNRNFSNHKALFQSVFEVARRYKLLNPERMRDSYVKMMYLLQDMSKPEVVDLLQFDIRIDVFTVYDLLKKCDRLSLLSDPFIHKATAEIIPREKTRCKVQEEIREKEAAIKRLATKYGHYRKFSLNFFSRNDDTPDEAIISKDQIERCLYSICDLNTFLRFNQLPCERMIELLEKYFSAPHLENDPSSSLSIVEGSEGARLSHSHTRQYTFVRQSLALWAEVMKDMLRLWHAAEADLLDPSNPYVRTETGQGLQRVQKAPRLLKLMTDLLRRVQHRLGGWVGSSTIHLGDENVPNALMFIDKYLQVPRILGPIVLCIDKIETAPDATTLLGVPDLVRRMGGVETVQKMILRDFFRHGFDGAGSSDFFSSGSCIDGRLTSAWNWCSQIESKPYFPLFQLTGFVGFDHSGK